MSRDPFRRKLNQLRYHYGQKAVDYFSKTPVCEDCGEARIATLNVHHTHGKAKDCFKTLCFNCHMLEHSKTPDYTAQDYVDRTETMERAAAEIEARREDLRLRAHQLTAEGHSLRSCGRILGVSYGTVKKYLDKAA